MTVDLTQKFFGLEPVVLRNASPLALALNCFRKICLSLNFMKDNNIESNSEEVSLVSHHELSAVKANITDDKNLLNQYFKLRNDIFRNERGWDKCQWLENDHDRRGSIVVALDSKEKVIGGARIMLSLNKELLSGEIANTDFVYKNLFKKLSLDFELKYGEIDGLIVAKGYRDRSVTEKILKCCIEHSLKNQCSYVVGIALPVYCKIYKIAYRAIGYSDVHILKDLIWAELPEYNYSRDVPIVNVIRATA